MAKWISWLVRNEWILLVVFVYLSTFKLKVARIIDHNNWRRTVKKMNFTLVTALQSHTPNRPSKLFLEQKDVNFLGMIVALLAGSRALNSIRCQRTKRWSSVLLSIGLIAFGAHYELHQLTICLAYGLLLATLIRCLRSSERLPTVIYLISFSLLTGLRFYYVDPALTAQTNLVLMMVVLRSISLAFDLQEFDDARKARELSLTNIFTYLFCCFGLFIGPFYRFQIYTDWLASVEQTEPISCKDKLKRQSVDRSDLTGGRLQSDQAKSDQAESAAIERNQKVDQHCRQLIIERIPLLLLMIVVFLIGNIYFPLNSIVVKKSGFFKLFAQTLLTFYIYRARLYVGFILSEIICIFGRFGVYPVACDPRPGHGPTIFQSDEDREGRDKKNDDDQIKDDEKHGPYSSETIRCVSSVRGVELSGSVQYSLRHWNQTVQFWLSNYCYTRLKGNSDLLRMYTTLFIRWANGFFVCPLLIEITLTCQIVYNSYRSIFSLASALWHGRYPGYFLAFIALPVLIYAERPWQSYVKDAMNNSLPIFLAFWFFKISIVAYFGMSFYLLQFDQILNFYQATYL